MIYDWIWIQSANGRSNYTSADDAGSQIRSEFLRILYLERQIGRRLLNVVSTTLGGRREATVLGAARRLGPEDFLKMLLAKGKELKLLREETITDDDGRFTVLYHLRSESTASRRVDRLGRHPAPTERAPAQKEPDPSGTTFSASSETHARPKRVRRKRRGEADAAPESPPAEATEPPETG